MAVTIGGFIIDPNGQTLVVDVTTPGGARPTVYTASQGSSTHTLPVTITTRTGFFITQPLLLTVSVKRNGVEIASQTGTTVSVDVQQGVVQVITPGVNANTAEDPSLTATYAPLTFETTARKATKFWPSPLGFSPKTGSVVQDTRGKVVVKDVNGTGRHIGFPGACVTDDGTVIAVWRDAAVGDPVADSVQQGANRGVIKASYSHVRDLRTWTAAATVFDSNNLTGSLASIAGCDCREPTLTVLQNGTVVMSVVLAGDGQGGGTNDRKTIVVPSSDGGTTFPASAAVDVGAASGYTNPKIVGPVVQLANGTLAAPLAVYVGPSDTFRSACVVFSTNNGATWGSTVLIRNGQTDSINYDEPNLVLLADGTLVVFMRNLNTDIRRSTSTDGGLTWSAPASVLSHKGAPRAVVLGSGGIVMICRHLSTNDTAVFTSWDSGATWSSVLAIESNAYWFNYGTLLEISTGNVLAVYAVAPDTTHTDIYADALLDGFGQSLFGTQRGRFAKSVRDKRTSTTISNDNTEQTIATLALPTDLESGDIVRFTYAGTAVNNSTGAINYTFKIKIGTTTVLTTNALSVTNSANTRQLYGKVEVLIANPASDQRVTSQLFLTGASTAGFPYGTGTNNGVGYGTAAEDLTAVKNILVTVTMGTADSNANCVVQMATLEVVKRNAI